MIVILAFLLDPISLILAIVGACFIKRPWQVLVLGLIVGLLMEVLAAAVTPGDRWGTWIIARLIAATVHSWLGYAIVSFLRRKRAARRKTS